MGEILALGQRGPESLRMRQSLAYFELQAHFARAIRRVLCVTEEESFRRFTTFYKVAVDNDAGSPPSRWSSIRSTREWQAFVRAVEAGSDPARYVWERSEWEFGGRCFGYDYWAEQRTVRIHFGNSPDGLALRPESTDDRLDQLRDIIADVVAKHPEAAFARVPLGSTTYRRTDVCPTCLHRGVVPAGYLYPFTALWGQFLDRYGEIKPGLSEPFIRSVANAETLDDLNTAFPYEVLATLCG